MKSFLERTDMDEKMIATLTQMMESQAYRELVAAQMFGYGLQFVPKLKWMKFITWHITEEMSHYEAVARMYETFTGESVEMRVAARLAKRQLRFAQSWFELAMAQFLYDRGGYFQLRELSECAFVPYRSLVEKVLKEEAGHQAFGERLVVDLCKSGLFESVKQQHFETWFREGMLSFGRPDTEGDRYAVENGLKKRSAALVMQDFLNDIKPAVKTCGLRFPDPKAIGLDVGDTLDFSLEGLPEAAESSDRESGVHDSPEHEGPPPPWRASA